MSAMPREETKEREGKREMQAGGEREREREKEKDGDRKTIVVLRSIRQQRDRRSSRSRVRYANCEFEISLKTKSRILRVLLLFYLPLFRSVFFSYVIRLPFSRSLHSFLPMCVRTHSFRLFHFSFLLWSFAYQLIRCGCIC